MSRRYERFYTLKIVRTRKPHNCVVCSETIPVKSRALLETGFSDEEGFFSNYFHTDEKNGCHLDYIDACQPNEEECGKIKDPNFSGDILHSHIKRKQSRW